jgi:transcriptional antiterminator NusG
LARAILAALFGNVMSSVAAEQVCERPVLVVDQDVRVQPNWYAIKTRPRHEKKAARELQASGISTFLPLIREVHRWSDRRQKVEVPLFPGYAFVNIYPVAASQCIVLRASGVEYFVGASGKGTPISPREIEELQRLLASKASFLACGFLQIGQKVRIRSGCLDGMEGILVAQNNDRKLVISVELIHKSVAISVEGYDIEPA